MFNFFFFFSFEVFCKDASIQAKQKLWKKDAYSRRNSFLLWSEHQVLSATNHFEVRGELAKLFSNWNQETENPGKRDIKNIFLETFQLFLLTAFYPDLS